MPSLLRRVVDIVAVTAACGVFAGVGWHAWSAYEHGNNVKKLSNELRRFDQVLAVQAASGRTPTTSRGWPEIIDPVWFGGDPPRNPLLSQDRPWVEVAPQAHASLSHPPVPTALDRSMAAFWYNPFQGIVRARVPMQMSDARTLDLYNTVNRTSLASLHKVQPALPLPEDAANMIETASVVDDDTQ